MDLRYYFCENSNANLVDFLKSKKIKYKDTGVATGSPLIVFNIRSSDKNYEETLNSLRELGVREPLLFAEYSSSEYDNAKLLVMRPKKQKIEITSEDAYRYSCRWVNPFGEIVVRHEEQIGPLAIAKEPPTSSTTAFWCEDTGFSVIFANRQIVDLVAQNELTGISFSDVFLRNGKRSENLFQMTSPYVLSRSCIGTGHGEIVEKCPHCGAEQYFIGEAHQLHLDFSKIPIQADFYMTEPIFGQGDPYSMYLISQRFYQLLKRAKLSNNVTFKPVAEIT